MTKVLKSTSTPGMFTPTDRELTLRAQIKTGWSTLSSGDHRHKHAGITAAEMSHIHQVLEKAQAVEHMEDIRIGLQLLKHEEAMNNSRGNGVTTCKICNRDMFGKKTSQPEPIQLCNDCQMVVCKRCQMQDKIRGELILLCTVCYEARELWRKSGSWLNNSVPVVHIPMEELIAIRQQKMNRTVQSHNHNRGEADFGFVNPYQLEAEDQDDDDESSLVPSTSGRQAAELVDYKSLDSSSSPVAGADESQPRAFKEGGKIRSRESGLSRRSAISKADKNRLLGSRERARSRSRSGSRVPGPSVSSPSLDKSSGGPQPAKIPSIKIRKPSTPAPELGADQPPQETPPSYEPEASVQIGTFREESSSGSTSPEHVTAAKPVPVPRSRKAQQEVLEREFVKTGPLAQGEFKTTASPGLQSRDEASQSQSAGEYSNLSRKVEASSNTTSEDVDRGEFSFKRVDVPPKSMSLPRQPTTPPRNADVSKSEFKKVLARVPGQNGRAVGRYFGVVWCCFC